MKESEREHPLPLGGEANGSSFAVTGNGHAKETFSFGEIPPLRSDDVITEQPDTPSSSSLAIPPVPGFGNRQLEHELEAAHEEIRSLHEMLEDLPEIFERKFQQRLQTVMEQQKHLLSDNEALRQRLYALSGTESDPAKARDARVLLPTVQRRPRSSWRQVIRHALRLDRNDGLRPRDGERPRVA